jgi:nickel-type superoxide dismutase maturation protease
MSMPPGRKLVVVLTATLATLLLLIFTITKFVAVPWTVEGNSMTPTLKPGDRVLVDLWTYRNRTPETGDLVLLQGPGPVKMVKRVSAVEPGGRSLHVLGDNPAESADSRHFGPFPREKVRGKVFFRYWPPSEAGPIR